MANETNLQTYWMCSYCNSVEGGHTLACQAIQMEFERRPPQVPIPEHFAWLKRRRAEDANVPMEMANEISTREDAAKWLDVARKLYGFRILCGNNHRAIARLLSDIYDGLCADGSVEVTALLNAGEDPANPQAEANAKGSEDGAKPVGEIREDPVFGNVVWGCNNLPHGTKLYAAPQPKASPVEAVPEGWQLVPMKPSEAMEKAGWIDEEVVCPCDIYAAMLAAAPRPTDKPAEQSNEEDSR